MLPNELQLMCKYALEDLEGAQFAKTAAALREILAQFDTEQAASAEVPREHEARASRLSEAYIAR
jgi:hypothetical protein